MAKKSQSINEILKELADNAKPILYKAVDNATNIASEDIYKFSMSCLDRYYENYTPSIYNRTDSLWKATQIIAEVEDLGDAIMSTVGVEYDAGVLESHAAQSYSEASSKYGHVDGAWVIENYLMGIHPATNGGRTSDTAVYIPWQDAISPDAYLKKYLQLYKNKFNNTVYDYLIAYIV